MSRRHKDRQHPGTSLAWIAVAVGAVLVIAAIFMFTGGSLETADSGSPHIALSEPKIDFGYVKLGETRAINISVTNTGDAPLRFKEKPYIEVVEGCCPPELNIGSMVLAPGETTTVTSGQFMMHAGMDGPHNFAVHLLTNDRQDPDLVATVLSDWGP